MDVVVVELVESAGLFGSGVSSGGAATTAADAGASPVFDAAPMAGDRARPMVRMAAARRPLLVRTGGSLEKTAPR